MTNWDQVTGYDPTPSGLKECLSGAEIVLIPAGVPRKPGMTRDGACNPFTKAVESMLMMDRSVQHQCLHRPRPRQGRSRALARGQPPDHLQPSMCTANAQSY